MQNSNIDQWLADNPDTENLRAFTFDLNGIMRGKRLPITQLQKVLWRYQNAVVISKP